MPDHVRDSIKRENFLTQQAVHEVNLKRQAASKTTDSNLQPSSSDGGIDASNAPPISKAQEANQPIVMTTDVSFPPPKTGFDMV